MTKFNIFFFSSLSLKKNKNCASVVFYCSEIQTNLLLKMDVKITSLPVRAFLQRLRFLNEEHEYARLLSIWWKECVCVCVRLCLHTQLWLCTEFMHQASGVINTLQNYEESPEDRALSFPTRNVPMICHDPSRNNNAKGTLPCPYKTLWLLNWIQKKGVHGDNTLPEQRLQSSTPTSTLTLTLSRSVFQSDSGSVHKTHLEIHSNWLSCCRTRNALTILWHWSVCYAFWWERVAEQGALFNLVGGQKCLQVHATLKDTVRSHCHSGGWVIVSLWG